MVLQSFGLHNLPETDVFPFSLELIKNLENVKFNKNVTFFVGENGSGKSTVLEALAYAAQLPTAGGMSLEQDPMMEPARMLGRMLMLRYTQKQTGGFFARAEDFIGFVKNILYNIAELDREIKEITETWETGDIALAIGPLKSERKAYTERYSENLDGMSHGEGFLKFFNARITGKGLYLIDEPEAALSPQRQMSLMALILHKIKENDSQFIIATHSPLIMAMPDSEILNFENNTITPITYRETQHYQLTKTFLDNPDLYLRHLGE
jgi:predicted ATPase